MIELASFRTEGLGDSTYLVTFDGLGILVDPQRDYDRFLTSLGDAQLRWVLETHLHNDYVSGGLAAAKETGAELVLPAGAAPAFRHTPAFHHEDLEERGLTIRPLHTPGHTPEHMSYVIVVDGKEHAVFSGGSLLVGSAGRSDLLGDDRADTLARLQYRSVRRLAALAGETALYPTHGAGSFCSASPASATSSTIAQERRTNPVLQHSDEEAFVSAHLSDLQPYPSYYARMSPINLAGPPAMPSWQPTSVDPADVDPLSTVVDIRSPERYAAGHFPGALNIPLSDQFATWFGWLLPGDVEAYLVADRKEDAIEARVQLARIGVDEIAGVIFSDYDTASVSSGTARIADVSAGDQILDVRAPSEREMAAPKETIHRYLPDLLAGPPVDLDQSERVWVVCATGYRSAIAASILRRHGIDAIPILDGGVEDLVEKPGF